MALIYDEGGAGYQSMTAGKTGLLAKVDFFWPSRKTVKHRVHGG